MGLGFGFALDLGAGDLVGNGAGEAYPLFSGGGKMLDMLRSSSETGREDEEETEKRQQGLLVAQRTPECTVWELIPVMIFRRPVHQAGSRKFQTV